LLTGNFAVGQPSQHTDGLHSEIPNFHPCRSRTYPLRRKIKLGLKSHQLSIQCVT